MLSIHVSSFAKPYIRIDLSLNHRSLHGHKCEFINVTLLVQKHWGKLQENCLPLLGLLSHLLVKWATNSLIHKSTWIREAHSDSNDYNNDSLVLFGPVPRLNIKEHCKRIYSIVKSTVNSIFGPQTNV